MRSPYRWASLVLAVVAGACGDSGTQGPGGSGTPGTGGSAGSPTEVALPWPLTEFPELPDIAKDVPEERIQLGYLLFFDPILSIDKQTACVTCHSEQWGMADGLARAVGHGAGLLAGPGRRGPNNLRRNSPTLYNLAFRESLFWDGRAVTLEEQALTPMFAQDEMAADPAEVVVDLAGIPEYAERFADAFSEDPRVTIDHVASALAAYERTFISDLAKYDAYVAGRPELMNEDQVEGMFRFAEMGCDSCHAPPLFESETFANRNVPEVEGIVDHGLEELTGLEEDRGRFRAITLRNLRNSQPYFHNGSAITMKDAVRHELVQSGMPFTEDDVHLITVFINKALRDETREAIRPASVPSGLQLSIDPSGSR